MRHQPRQHRLQRRRLLQVVIGAALRLAERLEQRLGDPAICLIDLAADGDGVHDREDAGLAEIGALDLHEILEQAPHLAVAPLVGRRLARGIERVDLARAQHRGQGLVRPDPLDPDVGRQVELQLLRAIGRFLPAGEIRDVIDLHAVLVRQDAADPDRSGHLILGAADPLALEVGGLADAGRRVHIDRRMAEEARWEHRNGDEGARLLEAGDDVRRQRHLGDIELAMPQHAEEGLFDRHVEIDEVDAVRHHALVHQRAGAIVVPAAERQAKHVSRSF